MMKKRDANQWAAEAVAAVTGLEVPKGVFAELMKRQETKKLAENAASGKNPAAVALGRRGGLKGGKARATALTAVRRSAIAKIAAQTRWKREQNIFALMVKGIPTREIAASLGLTLQAVTRALGRLKARIQQAQPSGKRKKAAYNRDA